MEEFDASDIVARVVEGEAPHLRHSCIPSTYKGVSEQVNIAHYSDSYLFLFFGCHIVALAHILVCLSVV